MKSLAEPETKSAPLLALVLHFAALVAGVVPIVLTLSDPLLNMPPATNLFLYLANIVGLFLILQLKRKPGCETLVACADQLWIGSFGRFIILGAAPLEPRYALLTYFAMVILAMAAFSPDPIRERVRYLWLVAA